jgi:mucolipin 3
LVLFSQSSFRDAQFLANNIDAFHHLFIKDYESGESVDLYTRDDVFDQLVFAVQRYFVINETAVGSYDFASAANSDVPPPVTVCYTAYKQGLINSFNWTYKFDPGSVTDCSLQLVHNESRSQSGLTSLLKQYLGRAPFDRVNTMSLKFSVRTVFLNAFHFPDCRQFDIVVTVDNSEHNGVAHLRLAGDMESFECNGVIVKTLVHSKFVFYTFVDVIVAIISLLSIALCVRSFIKTYHLAQLAADFFRKYCQRPLKTTEMLGLVNLWFVCTMSADILLVVGSVGKILISQKLDTEYFTWSMLLGIGTGLVWISLLRFLGYFQKYNILLVTMKAAMPSVLRFMLCTLILYVAFLLCGWAVLGPYNEKFKNIETTSECLFSLLNGDDMYNTFKLTTSTNQPAVIFCQIYLYVFIGIFIYVVLNLFIGLISEMYAAVRMMGKKQWKALYLGKLYYLLDEDEDDDWNDDIIDWHRHGILLSLPV